MVFRSKPYRQSVFLAQADPLSVARAEFQQEVVDLMPIILRQAQISGCDVERDIINGPCTVQIPLTTQMTVSRMILFIEAARGSADVLYDVRATWGSFYRGRLSGNFTALKAPIDALSFIYLILQFTGRAKLNFAVLFSVASTKHGNFDLQLPYPDLSASYESWSTRWRIPAVPEWFTFIAFFSSADGNTASLDYIDCVNVTTFSTTSTSPVRVFITRKYLGDCGVRVSPNNAVIHLLRLVMHGGPRRIPINSLQMSYSTTSTSYVQYTPLNLTTTLARIRRIVVSSSNNARWYVNIDGRRVLDSAWGITSLDFNPPMDAYRVDLYLASSDGANATASIIIIYDEVPGRL